VLYLYEQSVFELSMNSAMKRQVLCSLKLASKEIIAELCDINIKKVLD